jgi:hypothetical protein
LPIEFQVRVGSGQVHLTAIGLWLWAGFEWNADKKNGRGGWIRTNAWQDQNLLPYRLATPL